MESNNRFLGLIQESVIKHWELPAFSDYKGTTHYYKDIARRIEKIHIVLENAGIQKGDKVALIGRNSSNWATIFFGVLTYGAVVVPILHEFKPDNIHNIVNHSDAKFMFVGDIVWENLNEALMPELKGIVMINDFSLIKSRVEGLDYVMDHINELFGKKFPRSFRPESISYHIEEPDELAVLNYTSGTTGFAKGVMIPYRSLWSNTQFAADNLPFMKPSDNVVCMLPMAHMYGLAFEILNSFNIGCHVHFLTRTPSPKIILDAFSELKPRLILAVPLIIEKIVKNKVFPEIEKPWMKLLLKVPFVDTKLLEIIGDKLNQGFGGNFEEIVVGGAAINKDVEKFLRSINFRYTVGYGMTECGPLISYTQWDSFKAGSCGQPVDRMEVRIDSANPAQVGEIQVKGMNVMLGYYKNEDATKNTFTNDGWLKTGDLGIIDEEKFIFIKGRSKTMILGPSGQNIYPEEIEDQINNLPCVAESLVIEKSGKLVALIYPDFELLKQEGVADVDIEEYMLTHVKALNSDLPSYSPITDVKIMHEEFEKTPKRSIKRYLYQ
ncbi:MAG: AMP-binding protein [Bacteroidales bacterium]